MANGGWITPGLVAAVQASQAAFPGQAPQQAAWSWLGQQQAAGQAPWLTPQQQAQAEQALGQTQQSWGYKLTALLTALGYTSDQISAFMGEQAGQSEQQIYWAVVQEALADSARHPSSLGIDPGPGMQWEYQIYDSLTGAGQWTQVPAPEQQQGQRTQIVTQMVDGVPHSVLIDLTTGQVIQDLGPSVDYSWQEQQLQAQREEAERQRQFEWGQQVAEMATKPKRWIDYWRATEGGTRTPEPGWYSEAMPPTPSWLTQFTGQPMGQPIESRQVKMAGPQTWGQMAPSAQQGLGGYLGWTGVPEEDYFKRMQRAWTGVFPAGQTWMTRWGAR